MLQINNLQRNYAQVETLNFLYQKNYRSGRRQSLRSIFHLARIWGIEVKPFKKLDYKTGLQNRTLDDAASTNRTGAAQ